MSLPAFLLLGRAGERQAESYLKGLGYRPLGRGVRAGRREIDLVMEDGETVVFVEVKTRSTGSVAPAECFVGWRKRRLLAQAALCWLERSRRQGSPVRFDVVAVEDGEVRHIPAAFEVPGFTL